MTLGRCLQLAAVQYACAAGQFGRGVRVRVHPVGRDRDGDPVVAMTWPDASRQALRAYVVAFRDTEPWG